MESKKLKKRENKYSDKREKAKQGFRQESFKVINRER
jgi:hypothetical protein